MGARIHCPVGGNNLTDKIRAVIQLFTTQPLGQEGQIYANKQMCMSHNDFN